VIPSVVVKADINLATTGDTIMAKVKQTQAQATTMNGSNGKAPAKANAATIKWSTVTVTATTPAYSVNRATPMDIAYDAARINGHAIVKIDGKADKAYVRCADGTVRSAKSSLAVEALAAHAKA
jgi:hypothetical protein